MPRIEAATERRNAQGEKQERRARADEKRSEQKWKKEQANRRVNEERKRK